MPARIERVILERAACDECPWYEGELRWTHAEAEHDREVHDAVEHS